jgi:hypothetical protein
MTGVTTFYRPHIESNPIKLDSPYCPYNILYLTLVSRSHIFKVILTIVTFKTRPSVSDSRSADCYRPHFLFSIKHHREVT